MLHGLYGMHPALCHIFRKRIYQLPRHKPPELRLHCAARLHRPSELCLQCTLPALHQLLLAHCRFQVQVKFHLFSIIQSRHSSPAHTKPNGSLYAQIREKQLPFFFLFALAVHHQLKGHVFELYTGQALVIMQRHKGCQSGENRHNRMPGRLCKPVPVSGRPRSRV